MKYNAVFQIMKENKQSYVEGMNTSEFLCLWGRGVVIGHNILEAFKN